MTERPPLLLPPNPNALPAPQNGVAAATARPYWPQNPELTQQQVAQAKKDAKAKELAAREPLHPYIGKPTLFDKWFVKDKSEQVDDTPEPDPATDKQEGVAQALVVGNVEFREGEPRVRPDLGEPGPLEAHVVVGVEIIQAVYCDPCAEQVRRQVKADESRGARHQYPARLDGRLCHLDTLADRMTSAAKYGGWGGIRTPGEREPTPVFKTGALNHSATHPHR